MRYADCHPDRQHWGKGRCRTCYQRERTQELKALGLPWWRAQGRTITGWLNKIQRMYETRRLQPERRIAAYRRRYQKRKLLYGGDPTKSFHARIKWLEAKSAGNAAGAKPSAHGARHVDLRTLSNGGTVNDPMPLQTTPVDSIKTKRGANNPTLRYRVRQGKKITRARNKKKKP